MKGLLQREVSSCSITSHGSGEGIVDDQVLSSVVPSIISKPGGFSANPVVVRKVQSPNGWLQCEPVGSPIRCRPLATRCTDVAGFIPLKCPLSERYSSFDQI